MTIQELIDILANSTVDRTKEVFIYNPEWEQENPIDWIEYDSEGNVIIY